MKTAYYTYTSWEEAMASGFGDIPRQGTLVREPGQNARARDGGRVIDLNAWRAANRSWAAPEEEPDARSWDCGDSETVEPELVLPAPRPRRDHHRAMFAAELASTLAVAGTAAALMLRVLLF